MKICIRQEVLTLGDYFDITDENGEILYTGEQELFRFWKTIIVRDREEQEIVSIRHKFSLFFPCYEILSGEEKIGEIVREYSFLGSYYTVEGTGLTVDGSAFGHSYEIMRGEETVGHIEKEWLTFGDCYTLSFEEETDLPVMLAVLLAIDSMNES